MLSNTFRGSNILSPAQKDLSRFRKAQIKTIASHSTSKLVQSPSLGSLRKNKQINLPIITVHNLDKSLPNISTKSPIKSGISIQPEETKTTRTLGHLSPIIQNRSSFFNMISPSTNIRASQFKPLNMCFSPTEGLSSPHQKLSVSTDSPHKMSESPSKDDAPHYQSMTLSGVYHVTGKVKKENSRKFIFSKPRDSPLLVNLEPIGFSQSPPKRSSCQSSDSRSSASPEISSSPNSKLGIFGKGMGHAKKKSTFFTKKSMEGHEFQSELDTPKPQPKPALVKEKFGYLNALHKKRESSILTKELEARYGVQLRSPEISDDENQIAKSPFKSNGSISQKVQGDSPGDKLQDASTQATILWNSALKFSKVKSTEDNIEGGPMNFEELTKESEAETREIESSLTTNLKSSRRREFKSFSSNVAPPVVQEKDVFDASKGTFFKVNKSNKYIQKMNQTMTLFGAKSEQFLDDLIDEDGESNKKGKPTLTEPALDLAGNHHAMITQIGKRNLNQIVQPEFMEKNGTMCVTEFWGQKKKKHYAKVMNQKVKRVTIIDEKRKDEFLYKPKRWKEEDFVQAQMKKNAVENNRQVELAKEEAKTLNKIRIQPVPIENPFFSSKTARHLRKERSEPFLAKSLVKVPSSQNLRMLAQHVGKGEEIEKRKIAEERLRKMIENSSVKNKTVTSRAIQKNIAKIFQEEK